MTTHGNTLAPLKAIIERLQQAIEKKGGAQ